MTLVEVLVTLSIASLLAVALGGVVGNTLNVREDTGARNELAREAHFAMERMTRAVGRTRHLLVPTNDKLWSTGLDESVHDPGVLAVTLDPELDRDLDGFADADNDQDGRVDEDFDADWTNDGEAGLIGIDDDGSGNVDEGAFNDDDESGDEDEDPIDGLDDDDDQNIDEDPPGDATGDGAPGYAFVDDDGDGAIDEGGVEDDDEDGSLNEDWLDAVAYFLSPSGSGSGSDLIERFPRPGSASGTDYAERIIATNVTSFRVERMPLGDRRAVLVDLQLGLARDGVSVFVETRARVGGRL